jgi:hypothetical protein
LLTDILTKRKLPTLADSPGLVFHGHGGEEKNSQPTTAVLEFCFYYTKTYAVHAQQRHIYDGKYKKLKGILVYLKSNIASSEKMANINNVNI